MQDAFRFRDLKTEMMVASSNEVGKTRKGWGGKWNHILGIEIPVEHPRVNVKEQFCFLFFFIYIYIFKFIYFIYGCVGSSFLCEGFL